MNFRASFCDPFKREIIELGDIDKDKILETFDKIPWAEYLTQMKEVEPDKIHYSPSLEIENKDNRNGICVSAINSGEWYIFYKRPKPVKRFFGLTEKLDKNYLTEIQGQTKNDVKDCLVALIKNNLQFLEDKIK